MKALASAYHGSMAPFRAAIAASTSRDDALIRVAAAYADWKPGRVVAEVEEALQLCAAQAKL